MTYRQAAFREPDPVEPGPTMFERFETWLRRAEQFSDDHTGFCVLMFFASLILVPALFFGACSAVEAVSPSECVDSEPRDGKCRADQKMDRVGWLNEPVCRCR